MTLSTLWLSLSTPITRCPSRARQAAVTQPTYPRPSTATVWGFCVCGEPVITALVCHEAAAGHGRRGWIGVETGGCSLRYVIDIQVFHWIVFAIRCNECQPVMEGHSCDDGVRRRQSNAFLAEIAFQQTGDSRYWRGDWVVSQAFQKLFRPRLL